MGRLVRPLAFFTDLNRTTGRYADAVALTSRPASQVVIRATVFVALVLVALFATFLRQEGVPKANTLWAEDGAVFAACAYERGPLPCITEAYGGYFHVTARLGAFVVPMGDPADLPFRITLVSALFAAAAALLAGRAVAQTSGSWIAGLLAGSAVVLVYPAGREVLGNLANLHWILFTAASTVLVCSWAGRRLDLADIGLVVLTALSSPFAVILPALALGGVVRRTPRAGIVTVLLALATLPQVVSVLTADRAWTPAHSLNVGAMADLLGAAAWQSWFGPGWATSKVVVVLTIFLLALVLVAPGSSGPRWQRHFCLSSGMASSCSVTLSPSQRSRSVRWRWVRGWSPRVFPTANLADSQASVRARVWRCASCPSRCSSPSAQASPCHSAWRPTPRPVRMSRLGSTQAAISA